MPLSDHTLSKQPYLKIMKLVKSILLVILLLFACYGGYSLYKSWIGFQPKKEVSATVLLERVEKVMKLVTVEGNFSEIYDYKHHLIADVWPFRKKALVRVNAKVLVGYDFESASININEETKTITISNLPAPEILTIEHDLDYYNFENGLFNMISNKDITAMGFEAKEFIMEKAKESDLFDQAEIQRKELFEVLQLAIEASGWTLIVDERTNVLKL
jgi:hypothetical protein